VAGEIVAIVSEYLEALEDWRRGIIRPPSRPPRWRFWFDIAATLLVIGGVFGEAGATGAVASINSQLRSTTSELRAKSDQLLALVTREAGDVRTSAEGAANAASSATDSSDKAKASASLALTTVQSAQNNITALDGKIALSSGRIADVASAVTTAQNQLDEVQADEAPREILHVFRGKASNVDNLRPFIDQEVILESIPDFEPAIAAGYVKDMLEWAGFKVTTRPYSLNWVVAGVRVEQYNPDPNDRNPELRRRTIGSDKSLS
jgi:hypothetical protein